MDQEHVVIGIALLAVTLLFFPAKCFRAAKRGKFRAWGWAGLAVILSAELLLFFQAPWVRTFFTPVVWTGYLLLVDAMVARLRGSSRLESSPGEFLTLVFWSFPLWMIFEGYNLRLENWTYVGLPDDLVVRSLGYFWSFATIWPAIFETADLVAALGLWRTHGTPRATLSRRSLIPLFILGLLMVTLPVALPVQVGRYLFGPVWIGFVFLLDPLNYHWNGHSLLREWEQGQTSTLKSFMLAGLVCGILWEFWNYWAGAKWQYIFPIGQELKIFEMPLPGYLGFPPFALECLVIYEFLKTLRNRFAGLGQGPAWQTASSRS